MKKNILLLTFVAVYIFIIFHQLLLAKVISGGDLPYFSNYYISHYTFFPYAWKESAFYGMGGYQAPLLGYEFSLSLFLQLTKFFSVSWFIGLKALFILGFLSIAVGIFIVLLNLNLFKNKSSLLISIILLISNTYVLLLIDGGQWLITSAYMISILLIFYFIYVCQLLLPNSNFHRKQSHFLLFSVLLAIDILIDVRIAYIALAGIIIQLILLTFYHGLYRDKIFIKNTIYLCVYVIPITFCINAFWLIPTIFVRKNILVDLGTAYTSINSVRFFSFADFAHTLSLLHPNWPDNIFGVVHFMQPEFLLLPLLAFSSLLSIKKKQKSTKSFLVLYFSFLAFIGIFLAKGTNDPFGSIYEWLFLHFPGFVAFRDSTKWYVLIVASYIFLIPYGIETIEKRFSILNSRIKKIFTVSSIIILVFLIRPAIMGELRHTFATHTLPDDYLYIEKMLDIDTSFSRILWIPSSSLYEMNNLYHPSVNAVDLYKFFSLNDSTILLPDSLKILRRNSIHYIILPSDPDKQIYIKNGKYSQTEQKDFVLKLQKQTNLPVHTYKGVYYFIVPNSAAHLSLINSKGTITFLQVDPTRYKVKLRDVSKGDRLLFSDWYDSQWSLSNNSIAVKSQMYDKLNSFRLPSNGTYEMELVYLPQKYVTIGIWVSISTVILLITGFLVYLISSIINNKYFPNAKRK